MDYSTEVALAYTFLNIHNNDTKLRGLINQLKFTPGMLHSDKWSIIYDYLYDHYINDINVDGLVTGLSYIAEGY